MKLNTSKLAILMTATIMLSLLTLGAAYAAPDDLDRTFSGDGKLTDLNTLT